MPSPSQPTQTQTSTSTPWSGAQPYLKDVLARSQTAYNTGEGFKPYPDSTVVPFSGQSLSAMQGIESAANAGNPLGIASRDQALGILNSGGMSDWQRGALEGTYDVATGEKSLGMEGDYRGLLSRAGNPGFESVLDTQAGKLADDVNRGFSNAGRYGSAAHTGALVDQIGDFRARAASDNYQQGIQNELGILGQIGQVRGADIANQVGAGQAINQAGQGAANQVAQFAGLAPDIYQQGFTPYEKLAGVGSQYEDLATRELQDQISKYEANQQDPWRRLSAYNALIGGQGQLGGTTTTSAMAPRNYMAPVGGGLLGAQLGSQFGYPLLGAAGGGLLGLLGM